MIYDQWELQFLHYSFSFHDEVTFLDIYRGYLLLDTSLIFRQS